MSVTAAALTKQDEEQRGALVERLFHGGIAVLEMLSITWAIGSASIEPSPKMVLRHRASWRDQPAFTSGTRGSGSSNKRWRGSSR